MYINFELLVSYELVPEDVLCLQAIFQNKFEDNELLLISIYNIKRIEKFENLGLVKYIKGTKKSSKFKLVRLSDKGSSTLELIQIPLVNQDDLNIFNWLESIYKKEEKEIGNAKKTKSLISQFRVNSGIERNHLAYLCKTFILDEREMEWSKKLEFLFWKPSNLFQTKFDIEQSRLYQYYLKRKDYFDEKFKNLAN